MNSHTYAEEHSHAQQSVRICVEYRSFLRTSEKRGKSRRVSQKEMEEQMDSKCEEGKKERQSDRKKNFQE